MEIHLVLASPISLGAMNLHIAHIVIKYVISFEMESVLKASSMCWQQLPLPVPIHWVWH